MELRHLRYFVAVAEHLHFSRAAAQLHLTQPALSRQIRDLETELGVKLLQRHGTRTALTPAGERFRARARELLAAADAAVEEARTAARQMRFGHYGSLWVDYYAPGLRAFARRFPDVAIQPVELTPAELVAALRRGELDVALLGPASDALRREFVTRRLGATQAVLAIGAGNPLAKRRAYRLAELKDARWLEWDEGAFPGRGALLREAAAAAGFRLRVAHRVDSVASVFMRVATSDAIGYVLPMARKLPHAGVAFAAIKGPPSIEFEMNLGWRRDSEAGARHEALADCLAAAPPR